MPPAKLVVLLLCVALGAIAVVLLSRGKNDGPAVDRDSIKTSVVQRLITPTGPGLFVGAPACGFPNSSSAVYKLADRRTTALRVQVKFGRPYLGFIEVEEGLSESDEIITSDMSAYDAFDTVFVK